MSEIIDTLKHAKYYKTRTVRVESNCSEFQETGSSPRKLKTIWVEWSECFIFEDDMIEEVGRFGKRFNSIVHARSFAMALVMEQVNTTNLKKEEYEHWDGWDSKDENYLHENEPTKVLLADSLVVLDYVFDFGEKII